MEQRALELMRQILDTVRSLPADVRGQYSNDDPVLHVVTALAEGADRAVARAAIRVALPLDSVLPLDADSYSRDFRSSESKAEFKELLAASSVVQLDGGERDGETRERAYLAANELIVMHSQVLIAIWDGSDARGPAGTANVVRAALRAGIPVLWINSSEPELVRLADSEGQWRPFTADALRGRVIELLRPPRQPEVEVGLADYRGEVAQPVPWFGQLWQGFRRLGGRDAGGPRLSDESGGSVRQFASLQQETIENVVGRQFRWADQLATRYANLYRSSFLLAQVLGVVAVFVAVAGQLAGWDDGSRAAQSFKAAVSLGAILAILGIKWLTRRKRWHDRWIDYRLLAEFLRSLTFLSLLGRVQPRARQPVFATTGDPGTTWMAWESRAIARELGLIPMTLSAEYLREVRRVFVEEWIKGQRRYHAANAAVANTLEGRLSRASTLVLAGTIGATVLLMITGASEWTILEAVLPALAAAIGGIRSQGELERLARRSGALESVLARAADELNSLSLGANAGASQDLAEIATQIATTMTDEVLDWRVVFASRPRQTGA